MEEQLKIDFEKSFKNSSFSTKNINIKKEFLNKFIKEGLRNKSLENWKFSDISQIIKKEIGDLSFYNDISTPSKIDPSIYLNGLESLASLWLQIKLILVIVLTIYHEYLGKCLRNLKNGSDNKSSKFYRIINEIPTILLILTVFVVIFKPL